MCIYQPSPISHPLHASVPLHMLLHNPFPRVALLFTAWSSQVLLILETQMKCLRYTSSVTLRASKDGLKWGEVPNIMNNTIRILDLHTDLHRLMAQNQQGTV